MDELERASWPLSEMEALLRDADRVASASNAYLMPRIEVQLPLYDVGRRLRLVYRLPDRVHVALLDEDGAKLADVQFI